jgi:exodeoxyribonuclease V alpha subunit
MLAQATQFSCTIQNIRFKADDTGYVVLAVERPEDFSSITAVGTMPDATKGMVVTMSGDWITHPKFGKQFKFDFYEVPLPTDAEGAVSYLATLKGLKGTLAQRVYDYFGDSIYDVLEERPEELINVKGIGQKILPKIIESYNLTKGMRKLIGFLHELGVSASYAKRIYDKFGQDSISEIKANPYILASTIRGFGFKKADELARGLGIKPDAKVRTQAGVMHTLRTATSQQGHCYLPTDELITKTCELLILPGYNPQMNDVEDAIKDLSKGKYPDVRCEKNDSGNVVYPYKLWIAEAELADFIKQGSGTFENSADITPWLSQYKTPQGYPLANQQNQAVLAAAKHKVSILTGGPGTGKSSVSDAIVKMWHSQNKRIIACAPSGKAARRLKETTGLKASTIHRLLGWTGTGFEHNRDNPLPGDAFLIDEFSMVDLKLAHSLFEAIPRHASIVMVGDVDQLPSVGPGNVLRDVINSGAIPVTRLTEVFRQGSTSKIISTSHQINTGVFPDFELLGKANLHPVTDALWIKCDRATIPKAITWLVDFKLADMGWCQDDIQCLSPMHKGDIGNIELNAMIQNLWNPYDRSKAELRGFRVGDRVIQMVNNYDKEIFNGDIGKITSINKNDGEVIVLFPDDSNENGRPVELDESDLTDLSLAYSLSIHKSQGSEFPVIIIPVSMSQYIMLQRNLLYTGVTRGKKLVVLVGEEDAIKTAVRTNKIGKRNTMLDARLAA